MYKIKIIVLTLVVFILLTSCAKPAPAIGEPVQAETSVPAVSVAPAPEPGQSEPVDSGPFLLRVKKGGEAYPVEGCIVDAFSLIYEEKDFPDRTAVRLAKEVIYGDEEWSMLIESYADVSPDAPDELTLEFLCGAYEDFNSDGKNESVILLGIGQDTGFHENSFYVYVNDNNAGCFMGSLEVERFELLRFGDSVCASVARTWTTGMGAGEAVFTFYDKPKSMFGSLSGRMFAYTRGYFSCYDYYRFIPDWQSIAIWDSNAKTIRELGVEEISKEKFVDFFENGAEGLERLEAATGQKDYKIYTQGYVYFFIYVSENQAFIFKTDENGEAEMQYSPDSLQLFYSDYLEVNDSLIYGINANNLKPIYSVALPEKTIDRINELAQKSKTYGKGLTEEEQIEFKKLKNEYLTAFDR